jgi:hypothetical protein
VDASGAVEFRGGGEHGPGARWRARTPQQLQPTPLQPPTAALPRPRIDTSLPPRGGAPPAPPSDGGGSASVSTTSTAVSVGAGATGAPPRTALRRGGAPPLRPLRPGGAAASTPADGVGPEEYFAAALAAGGPLTPAGPAGGDSPAPPTRPALPTPRIRPARRSGQGAGGVVGAAAVAGGAVESRPPRQPFVAGVAAGDE